MALKHVVGWSSGLEYISEWHVVEQIVDIGSYNGLGDCCVGTVKSIWIKGGPVCVQMGCIVAALDFFPETVEFCLLLAQDAHCLLPNEINVCCHSAAEVI